MHHHLPYGIPSVDLADFLSGDADRKSKFVQELGSAYEGIGFVALKNHGLAPDLVNSLYARVQEFFGLPEAIKLKYEVPGGAGQRGYTSFGKEHAKDKNEGDLKEFYQFGQVINPNYAFDESYPANIEVSELPAFNALARETYEKLETAGLHVLRAIALFLELEETYFDPWVRNGNSILRPIHYPPITSDPGDAVRSAEHEDINLITLLMGASADGLQVLNKAGEWVAVTALAEHVVVNVGDMLQRLTNNRLRSTTHRVVNPPKDQWGNSRFSIPFFLHPRGSMPLNCLPGCVNEQRPLAYEPIAAGEYLNQRLREIGLLK